MTDIQNMINTLVQKNQTRLKLMGNNGFISMLINDKFELNKIKNEIIRQNSWLYLKKGTFDGVYCIFENNKWLVYEQEKGINLHTYGEYINEGEAIGNLLIFAGYT